MSEILSDVQAERTHLKAELLRAESRVRELEADLLTKFELKGKLASQSERMARLEANLDQAMEALEKMAYNWEAHSAFASIQYYVSHASNCSPNSLACSCGLSQSMATFRAGRDAIAAVLDAARGSK
jgi:hypothetical protein